MKIVIPNDYQDMVDQLPCFELIRHHEVRAIANLLATWMSWPRGSATPMW